MSLRSLLDAAANSGTPQNEVRPQPSPVGPAGPDVDVSSILGPLIDGSFSQAQGQAAIMAGVRAGQPNEATMPMKRAAPLPGGGTAPLGGQAAHPATPP